MNCPERVSRIGTPSLLFAVIVLLSSIQLTARPAHAQCLPEWQPFDASTAGVPGVYGGESVGGATVYATTMWDPDGAGPVTPKLVVAGTFSIAGNTLANNIALFDLVTKEWTPLDTGVWGQVNALAVLPNGDLVAGGAFTIAGGVVVNNIARYNGAYWSPIGAGLGATSGGVAALCVLPNGDLIAGGGFRDAGGVNVIARWNGSAWLPIGAGLFGSAGESVVALAVLPNGHLVIGGVGLAFGGIARWNPITSAWSGLGSGVSNPTPSGAASVTSLIVLPNGDLIAGGDFRIAGGLAANRIARWNGSRWFALGSGLGDTSTGQYVSGLAILPNGNLVAAGHFRYAGGVIVNNIAVWSGTNWSGVGAGFRDRAHSLTALPSGEIIAGVRPGSTLYLPFTMPGVPNPSAAFGIARWDGVEWTPLSSGVAGMADALPDNETQVNAILPLRDGGLIVGGAFLNFGSSLADSVARWDGVAWSPLGSGFQIVTQSVFLSNGMVRALVEMPNGDIVAGGTFTHAGGVAVNNIARWNGTTWSPLGSGVPGPFSTRAIAPVEALCVMPNGDLIAGGRRFIGRWNGTSWTQLGSGVNTFGEDSEGVLTLALDENGDLIAAGQFNNAGGVANTRNLARWNGSQWSSIGSGVPSGFINAIAPLSSGHLIVGGYFSLPSVQARHVAYWNGSVWSAMGFEFNSSNAVVESLAVSPNGNVVAGGVFSVDASGPGNGVAVWNGSNWLPLDLGVGVSDSDSLGVSVLKVLPNGDLAVGGKFHTAGGVLAPFIARWATRPPSILDHPDAVSIDVGQTILLSAAAKADSGGISYQWRRDGVPVLNGAGGASLGGGIVSGASGNFASPTTGASVTLQVTGARASDSGQYSVVFTGTCGSSMSVPAAVVVAASCPADFNRDEVVDDSDFLIFLSWYNLLDCADPAMPMGCPGDLNSSLLVDDADFLVFLGAYNQLLCD